MKYLSLLFLFAFFASNIKPINLVASSEKTKKQLKDEPKKTAKPKITKKRKKKRPAGTLESTDLAVLKENKDYHKENKDYYNTLKWIDRIIAVASDSDDIQNARLEQADINYQLNEYEKATENYKEYIKLYPGSRNAEYAKYKQVASNYYRLNPPDRDQTLTVDTTLLAKEYLDNAAYKQFRKEVEEILEACLVSLINAEIEIFESNLKFKNYEGAQRRLDYLNEKYVPQLPRIKSQIQDLESSLELSKQRGKYVQSYKKERKPLLAKWTKKEFKKQF